MHSRGLVQSVCCRLRNIVASAHKSGDMKTSNLALFSQEVPTGYHLVLTNLRVFVTATNPYGVDFKLLIKPVLIGNIETHHHKVDMVLPNNPDGSISYFHSLPLWNYQSITTDRLDRFFSVKTRLTSTPSFEQSTTTDMVVTFIYNVWCIMDTIDPRTGISFPVEVTTICRYYRFRVDLFRVAILHTTRFTFINFNAAGKDIRCSITDDPMVKSLDLINTPIRPNANAVISILVGDSITLMQNLLDCVTQRYAYFHILLRYNTCQDTGGTNEDNAAVEVSSGSLSITDHFLYLLVDTSGWTLRD
jgi:hypothetical protein